MTTNGMEVSVKNQNPISIVEEHTPYCLKELPDEETWKSKKKLKTKKLMQEKTTLRHASGAAMLFQHPLLQYLRASQQNMPAHRTIEQKVCV